MSWLKLALDGIHNYILVFERKSEIHCFRDIFSDLKCFKQQLLATVDIAEKHLYNFMTLL